MNDLDELLGRLARAPAPPALEHMEERVLARLKSAPMARSGAGLGLVTAIAALIMGMAGGVPAAATGASSLAPLGPQQPLAPSSLLFGTP
ncbi:hypothetical protein ACFSC3_17825 [Sphingomonas floccifaciens]|nr:hypothetical protein [Sphingomonas metalli]